MILTAFPGAANNLAPVPSKEQLPPLSLSTSHSITVLETAALIDATIASLLDPTISSNDGPTISSNDGPPLCVSLDAEWNISRTVGVSTLQLLFHSHPNEIYIIPVTLWFSCTKETYSSLF